MIVHLDIHGDVHIFASNSKKLIDLLTFLCWILQWPFLS